LNDNLCKIVYVYISGEAVVQFRSRVNFDHQWR